MNSRRSANSLRVRGMSPPSVLESEHPSRSSVKAPKRTGAPRGGNAPLAGAPPASSVSSVSDMSIPTAYVGDCYSTVTPPLLNYQTLASLVWKSACTASRTAPFNVRRRKDYESFYYRARIRRRSAGFSICSRRAAIFESDRASSGRQFRLAGMAGGLQSERSAGREDQGVNRPRRRRANSLPILRLRPHAGGEACWGDGRADQGGYRRVGAGAENEH